MNTTGVEVGLNGAFAQMFNPMNGIMVRAAEPLVGTLELDLKNKKLDYSSRVSKLIKELTEDGADEDVIRGYKAELKNSMPSG